MSDTSLLFNFLRGRDTASPHMKAVARNTATMAASVKIAAIASVAATAAMAAGFAGLAGQAVALVAAIGPVVGILAYLPALGVAAVAGIIPLIMAFSGLAAALKQTSGGAGGSAQAIEAAERRIEMAQRAAVQAQLDLNAARRQATENLEDMALSLARARLDEEAATMAVADARRNLRETQRGGDRNEIARANLQYRESVQTLDEVRERLGDVTEESQKANEAGVEGSDEVKSALQRQADAVYELAAAQKAATSGGGGVDKAAEAYAKLSMAGKQLVDVLRAIGPSWRQVQQAVQQSVFAGVAQDIGQLSNAYLPVMRTQLVAIGQGWNNAFRGAAQLAATPGFVADVNTTLANTATMWQRIGSSFSPFLSGFRSFMVVGSTFLPSFGQWVLSIGQRFDRWAAAARASGRAHDWIQNALTVLSQVWQVTKNLGASIVAIFRAGDAGPAWLPGLIEGTAKLRAFLESTEGQQKLGQVFATLRDIGSQLWRVITDLGPAFLQLFSATGPVVDVFSVGGVVVGFFADNIDLLAKALPAIIALFILWKTVQAAHYAAQVVSIPVTLAQVAVNWRLASAMRANTTALSTNIGLTRGMSAAQATSNVVMTTAGVATQTASVGTRALGFAMKALPIIGWIALIIDLVMWIVELWNTNEGFRSFVIGAWNHIWSFLKMIGAWFAGPFVDFFKAGWHWIQDTTVAAVFWIHDHIQMIVDFITGLGGRITSAASGMWNGLVYSFKAAVNWLIRLWNDFRLTLGGGSILGVSIPSITLDTPNIPYMAEGGIVPATPGGRLAVLGDGGQDEAVIPLSRLGSMGGQEVAVRVSYEASGAESDLLRLLRKWIRIYGPPDAPKVFG